LAKKLQIWSSGTVVSTSLPVLATLLLLLGLRDDDAAALLLPPEDPLPLPPTHAAAFAGVEAMTLTEGLTIADRCQSKSSFCCPCPCERSSNSWSTPDNGLVGLDGEAVVEVVVCVVVVVVGVVVRDASAVGLSLVVSAPAPEEEETALGAAGLWVCIRATNEKKSSSADATAATNLASSIPDDDADGSIIWEALV